MNTVNAIEMLKYYYLHDSRTMCIAFSGGKDSTSVIYLVCEMLLNLQKNNQKLSKNIYIINSNTLAELPPLLEYLKNALNSIKLFAKNNNLPLIVKEVFPEDKDTLNVQLMGVGMPPPSNTFRWCTDKLKVNPIDKEIKKLFPDGEFISVIGTRKDESFSRSARIEKLSVKGTNLKINDRYTKASNLMPIEDWNTKNVWEYLLKQKNDLVNIDFLWQLYSDASGKSADECSFAGAGGKDIDEGKLGCGVSRFGCWQCYMVRDTDKSLDGLMKSGYTNIELYKEYRDWFWTLTQQGWEKTRDVYNHRTQIQDFYNKGGKENLKYNMTMPKGLKLQIRKKAFKRMLELQDTLNETIVTIDEIVLIQKRWLEEGDIELTAFKYARQHKLKIVITNEVRRLKEISRVSNTFYRMNLYKKEFYYKFSVLTLKRFAVQYYVNNGKIIKKFFPSKEEEKHIRKEWKKAKRIETQKVFINLCDLVIIYNENKESS